MIRTFLALLAATTLLASVTPAVAATPADLVDGCRWIDLRVAAEPDRGDAFGIVMRSLQRRCGDAAPRASAARYAMTREDVRLVEEIDTLKGALGSEIPDTPAGRRAAQPAPAPATARRDDKPTREVEPYRPEARPSAPARAGEAAPNRADAAPPAPAGEGVSGTWHMPEETERNEHVKRRLELTQKGKKVEGRLYEERWFDAPRDWVEKSCGGNTTFRMVTVAPVTGSMDKHELTLRRDAPKTLSCTCPSRCRLDTRKRGYTLEQPSGDEGMLRGSLGEFLREGWEERVATPGEATPGGPAVAPASRSFAGTFETRPFKTTGKTRVVRLELTVEGKKVSGTLTESFSQPVPLDSWTDRFCDGNETFAWTETWRVTGKVSGETAELRPKSGRILTCTCPSKCREPRRRGGLTIEMSRDGRSVVAGDRVYQRKVEPTP